MTHRLLRSVIVTIGLATMPATALAQKLVIVVRHAERADMGMGAEETDPLLSPAGTVRAQKLSTMLADSGVKAIYVTQFRRTQDTAKPLATKLHLAVEPTPASAEVFANRLKAQHPNDVVLVVAHSSTLPALIKALGGPTI